MATPEASMAEFWSAEAEALPPALLKTAAAVSAQGAKLPNDGCFVSPTPGLPLGPALPDTCRVAPLYIGAAATSDPIAKTAIDVNNLLVVNVAHANLKFATL